ncbi:glycosyltransferase family 2 protein [soil metagenome]
MKNPLVSCIVLTYNSEKYIKNCLIALEKITYPNVEILLVDNLSTDSTLSIVKKFASKIKVLANTENNGYAGGHNFGVQNAGGKYIFLLNPDTTVTPNFLQPLVEKMENDSRVAACQPLVYLSGKSHRINLSGKVTHYLGFDWLRDFEATVVRQSGEILSFSGSGVLLRSDALKKVGGLDASYFMYYEDTDLSWRLRMQGFILWYCSESVVTHDYKFIPDEKYQSLHQKLFWAERNRIYTLFKNYELSTLVLLVPIFILMELGLLVYFATKGWFGVKVKSYKSLWTARNKLKIARSHVQKLRKRNDREVIQDFKSQIDFSLFKHPVVNFILNPILFVYWKLMWPLV